MLIVGVETEASKGKGTTEPAQAGRVLSSLCKGHACAACPVGS